MGNATTAIIEIIPQKNGLVGWGSVVINRVSNSIVSGKKSAYPRLHVVISAHSDWVIHRRVELADFRFENGIRIRNCGRSLF